jgi:hypothetical protein
MAHAPSSRRSVSEGGVPLFFSHGGAPTGSELAVSPRVGAGVRLVWGNASPGHGDCVCGVKVATRASQGAGHGERWLGDAEARGQGCSIGERVIGGARELHGPSAVIMGELTGLPELPKALAMAVGCHGVASMLRRCADIDARLWWLPTSA